MEGLRFYPHMMLFFRQCSSGQISYRWLLLTLLIAIGFLWPSAELWAEDQSAAFSLTATTSTSAGEGLPFLEEGQLYKPMNITSSGELSNLSYQLNLYGQTDYSNLNSQQKLYVNSVQGEVNCANQNIRIGETRSYFSRYTLSHSVKGGMYTLTSAKKIGPTFSILYGIKSSDWDQFWGRSTYRRNVTGLRYQQPLSTKFWIATNYVQARDHYSNNTATAYGSAVLSVDWHYQHNEKLVINGETAFADTATSPVDDAETTRQAAAHRINTRYTLDGISFELEYERIDSDFSSLVTDITADREKLLAKTKVHHKELTEYSFSLLWYHDNLDRQLSYRTDHYQPRISILRKQLFKREHARLSGSYSYKRSNNKAANLNHHYLTFGYQDHFGSLISSSNLNIVFYDDSQATTGNEYTCNTTWSTEIPARDKFIFKPELRLGGWMIDDELNDAEKQVWEYSLGLGFSITNSNFEAFARIGQNQLINKNGDNIAKILTSLRVNYQLKRASQATTHIYIQGHLNDYSYTTASNDYAEIKLSSGLKMTF